MIDNFITLINEGKDTSNIEFDIACDISTFVENPKLFTVNIKNFNKIIDKCYNLTPELTKIILSKTITAYGDAGYSILGHIKCKDAGEDIIKILEGLSESQIIQETKKYLLQFDNKYSRSKYLVELEQKKAEIEDLKNKNISIGHEKTEMEIDYYYLKNDIEKQQLQFEQVKEKYQNEIKKLNNEVAQKNDEIKDYKTYRVQLKEAKEVISKMEKQLNKDIQREKTLVCQLTAANSKLNTIQGERIIPKRRDYSIQEINLFIEVFDNKNISDLEEVLKKDPSLIYINVEPDANILEASIRRQDLEYVKFLVKFIKKYEISDILDNGNLLWIAYYNTETVDIFNFLIDNGAPFNTKDENGETLLTKTCINGNFDLVQKLVLKGAYIEEVNNYGLTPLIVACKFNHFDIAKYLISKGANVMTEDPCGNSVLHFAAYYGNIDAAKYLLVHTQLLNKVNKFSKPPLFIACWQGHFDLANILIENKAETNDALFYASGYGLDQTVQYLLSKGVDAEICDAHNTTALMFATKRFKDVNSRSFFSTISFETYMDNPQEEICSLDEKDQETSRYINVINALIDNGADVNRMNDENETPLYIIRNFISQLPLVDYNEDTNRLELHTVSPRTFHFSKTTKKRRKNYK